MARMRIRYFWGMAGLGLALVLSACLAQRFKPAPEASVRSAPAARVTTDHPQFIYFTSDDVGLSGLPGSGGDGGLHFLTELFAEHRNPSRRGDFRTFDGAPIHFTFFVNTYFLESGTDAAPAARERTGENPVSLKRAWKEAVSRGHEIALHTHSHPHGSEFSVGQWRDEIRRNIDLLTRPWDPDEAPDRPNPASGLGLDRGVIQGFRAPFIEYNDNVFTAVGLEGLAYDSSIEEPVPSGAEGTGFDWPYRLDQGRPGGRPYVGSHPGLWEIPIYDFIVPDDEACPRYGLPAGLRARLKTIKEYFLPDYGGITGMDWNLWNEFRLSPDEFLATLKYTLERHLSGGRSPMIVGLHTDLYSDKRRTDEAGASPAERRAVIREFLEFALSRPEVRIVSCRELLAWMNHQAAGREAARPSNPE